MTNTWYLITAVAVSGLITLGLRALPFAALKPLRKSRFVQKLGQWMPAGILLILAVVIFRGQLVDQPDRAWAAIVSLAVTVAVHLLSKRRTLVSIAAGTTCYVLLINLV
ncbi:branched-chain amino acid transporter permease [Leucobacter sp. GX24907]